MTFGEVETRGFELAPWQLDALASWERGDDVGGWRGTLEIVTGGGKTLIALEAFARATRADRSFCLAVVVPTEALARQWRDSVEEWTTVGLGDVAIMGAGESGRLSDCRVLIAVLNSASKYLPDQSAADGRPLLLVVDECHRAGAPSFSRVLRTRAERRLGLSATPDREELDDDGLPIEYDAHLLGRSLGPVVYRFGLKEALAAGWLPDFSISHHGLELAPDERIAYEDLTRRLDDLAEELASHGVELWQVQRVAAQGGDAGVAARGYVSSVALRKDLLYRSRDRGRVAALIVERALAEGASRVLLFHERVSEAEGLAVELRARIGDSRVALEHSGRAPRERREALQGFRDGSVPVLVSVRSLIEGINVPEADVGISVAASASVRQRVQSLGRILRRGSGSKTAQMHLLYVRDTTDEAIYGKEDWADLTGPESNRYWEWPLGTERPGRRDGPPRTPLALEDDEWARLGRRIEEPPALWRGVVPEAEFSVDARGNVTSPSGAPIANPQGVGGMVAAVGRRGGRFRVTPLNRLVLVWQAGPAGGSFVVVGQLDEPFEVRVDDPSAAAAVGRQKPGDPYVGPGDKTGGSFMIKSARGGVVARRSRGGFDFALTDPGDDPLAANAVNVLAAWRGLGGPGRPFHVDSRSVAWVEDEGERRYLSDVPGGFRFRDAEEE